MQTFTQCRSARFWLLANFPSASKFSREWTHVVCLASNVILGLHRSRHRVDKAGGRLNTNDLPSGIDSLGSAGTVVLGEDHHLEVGFSSAIDELYLDISGHLADEGFCLFLQLEKAAEIKS